MSRNAVSGEHLAIAAHLLLVSFSIEPIQQAIEHLYLPFVECQGRPTLPVTGFQENGIERSLGLIHRPLQAFQKPE